MSSKMVANISTVKKLLLFTKSDFWTIMIPIAVSSQSLLTTPFMSFQRLSVPQQVWPAARSAALTEVSDLAPHSLDSSFSDSTYSSSYSSLSPLTIMFVHYKSLDHNWITG
ncbi:hypothetical protein BT96DRAFT_1000384 [Gymnopus androsaceus JB14]|uniref:Uncharacterized protein n=1 Tax=Gymnopus androsaceus JB14 TaxID=1447944 RepID=A0A6A4H3Z5_9AGAR|nr:hypothetical protein BT96DRAFT_1000384 [Gymnopus androsaceus JB14]